jgi:hypothetical protein
MYSSARTLFLITAILICSAFAFSATATTYLYLNSQTGDWVGGGLTHTFTPSDGTFTVQNTSSTVSINFHSPDNSQNWNLNFGSPASTKFARGQYVGAQRTAFRGPMNPGVDVSGDGRGCNTDAGQFLVSDLAMAPDGTVERLAIDFEQHCEGAAPALFGSFRYNSKISRVPRLGIGHAYTLKGNTGTSDSSVEIALSMPSTTR